MKICLIPTPQLTYDGGSTVHARQLATALASRGHEVHVICLSSPMLPGVQIHRVKLPLVHPVITYRKVLSSEIFDSIFRITKKLVEITKKYRLDIIHCHYATFTSISACMAKWLCNIPFVVTSFGRDLMIGYKADCRYKKLIKISFKEASKIIAVNNELASIITSQFDVPKYRLEVIPVGVDLKQFNPQVNGKMIRQKLIGACKNMVLFIGSCLSKEKGIEYLLKAIPGVLTKLPHTKFVIVGSDDLPEVDQKLRKFARSLGVQDAVVFVGRVVHSEIPKFIAAADVIVDPRLVGGFSTVVLESLASGKPVIASNVSGISDIVKSYENGILVETANVRQLVDALSNILQNESQKLELGEEGKRTVQDRYSLSIMLNKTIRVYETAISLHKGLHSCSKQKLV